MIFIIKFFDLICKSYYNDEYPGDKKKQNKFLEDILFYSTQFIFIICAQKSEKKKNNIEDENRRDQMMLL